MHLHVIVLAALVAHSGRPVRWSSLGVPVCPARKIKPHVYTVRSHSKCGELYRLGLCSWEMYVIMGSFLVGAVLFVLGFLLAVIGSTLARWRKLNSDTAPQE